MKPTDRIKHFRCRLKTLALAATVFAGAGLPSRADLVGHWLSGAENLQNTAATGSAHDGTAVNNPGGLSYSTDLPPGFTNPALRSANFANGAAVQISNTATSDGGYLNTFDGGGGSSTITIAFWAKGFPGDWSPWIAKGGEGPNPGYGWQVRRMANSSFAGFTVRGVPDADGWPASGINANTPNWQHITAVWDASAGTRTIYVNGVVSHVFTASSGTMITSPGNHLIIGGRQTDYPNLSHFYNGNLFDVRVYNTALDQQGVYDLIPQTAPQGLAAITGNHQVSLTWTASPGATSYTVSTKNTITNVTTTDVVTEPALLKTGLTNGQPYLFKVLGSNGGGDGPYSTEISATPALGTAKDILTFQIGGLPAKVSGNTVVKYMPVGTDVSLLTADYTISPFATGDVTYPSGSFVDFTTPKTFTITAENGSTKAYSVQVILADPLNYDFEGSIQGWTQIWPITGSGNVWENGGLGTPEGPTADGAETRFGRSPAFNLNNSGPLTFQLAGGEGNLSAPNVGPSAIPMASIDGGGFAGVALRDVDANIYVLSKRRPGNGGGYMSGSFTEAELAPYANDGKRYSLDFIDYNKGGWGWTRLDNVSIPGTLATPETPAPQANILVFSLAQPSTVTISGDTITLKLPFGTPVTALAPTYVLSDGANCNRASGSTQNFTAPVTYTVTSSNAAIVRNYLVSAVVMPDPAAALVGRWVSGSETLADTSGYTTPGTHDGVAVGGNAGLLGYSSDVPSGFTGKSLDLRAGNVGVMISNSATGDGGYANTFDDQIRGQVTISFWAKGFPGEWSPWIAKGGENGVGYQLRRFANDPVSCFTVRGLNNEDGSGSPINVNDTPAKWHHFAGVWDETTGTRSLYVDGVLSHDVNTPLGQVMNLASGRHLALGARQNDVGGGYGNYFSGLLYDVRIYKQKLFSNQVQALSTPATYLAWINANYPALSDKNPGADPDRDGVSNFDEFAFGLNPGSGSSLSPIVTMPNKATGVFQYKRLNPAVSGLTYKVMVSTNLAAWSEDTTAGQTVIATSGDVQTVSVVLSGTWPGGPRVFVRVSGQ
ncbi:LamG-like jellyroll fold domain-containing protein [Luteolibacter soli]|uniref:LamG-like jellyroll fold domain-containing protein n=1 Tax=Luteolibacter soli TaxID=3135280 RepID=A0ABU9AQ44_9BACT